MTTRLSNHKEIVGVIETSLRIFHSMSHTISFGKVAIHLINSQLLKKKKSVSVNGYICSESAIIRLFEQQIHFVNFKYNLLVGFLEHSTIQRKIHFAGFPNRWIWVSFFLNETIVTFSPDGFAVITDWG